MIVLAGPNGASKSTLYEAHIAPSSISSTRQEPAGSPSPHLNSNFTVAP